VADARARTHARTHRDPESTELVIATIPTVLGINESKRLLTALRQASIPCKRIVVNQLLSEGAGAGGGRATCAAARLPAQLLGWLAGSGVVCVSRAACLHAAGDAFIRSRLKEQRHALDVVAADPVLAGLRQVGPARPGRGAVCAALHQQLLY
jgi:anion-transporting  ArsA/GET3 family ATPase